MNERLGMSVIIYHNPKCSKSRETLALLQESGVELEIVDFVSLLFC